MSKLESVSWKVEGKKINAQWGKFTKQELLEYFPQEDFKNFSLMPDNYICICMPEPIAPTVHASIIKQSGLIISRPIYTFKRIQEDGTVKKFIIQGVL